MNKEKIQNILNYYLEYEINNIANSAEIKIDSKTFVFRNMRDFVEIHKKINELKKRKLEERIKKFLGVKVREREKLTEQIFKEIDETQSNKLQLSIKIKNLIKEKQNQEIKEKSIENFSNELFDIKTSKEFWVYAHNISCIDKKTRKMPLFVLKCECEENRISILESNINAETINTVLAIKLNRELADISLEYKEPILNYSKEIETLIDGSNVEEIIDLYYSKLQEYIGISKEDIKSINILNKKYYLNEEFVVSLDVIADEGIKYIKEDIELLVKLINNDGYIPNLLNKYLNGNVNKKDVNDLKYTKIYRGNYINKEGYGVGQNQYKIINTIGDNDLIAVEGPPGTGKTPLLKEIIANKIVERADLLLKNWNKDFNEIKRNNSIIYYEIEGFNNNNVIKSIVVSSKNGEAIENVGTEIDKQIKYMYPVARQYKRTNTIGGKKQKEIQEYKGVICLPLGKQDNIQDFKDFLYQKFIPMLEKVKSKKYTDQVLEKIKDNYKNQCKIVEDYEKLINLFNNIKDWNKYFYGIKISHKKSDVESDKIKIKEIQNIFEEDKLSKEEKLSELKSQKEQIDLKKKDKEKEKKLIKNSLKNVKNKMNNSKELIIENKSDIKYLKNQEDNFNKINKNIFSKLLHFSEYRKNKNIDFYGAISGKELEIDIENQKMSQYVSELSKLEKTQGEIEIKYNQLNNEYEKINDEYNKIAKDLKEIKLIEKFNQVDKLTFWDYKNVVDMAGRSTLNNLNQELFSAALKLNEAYIIKHSEEIIKNLKLFLPQEENSYICQKFYDSSDLYREDKQHAIKSLWNTVFLCFPVVTTTLDSFAKRCFHLIPEYVDLELIDEAGQILPHNFVSAAYRGRRAVIVGDVNQIEPIVTNVNTDFIQSQRNIGEKIDEIKIETNSVQSLANRNTDILNKENNIILSDHYRCENNIINFSNVYVYNNRLNLDKEDNMDKPFFNNMVALDVRGKKTFKLNENITEVEACIETIKYIKEENEEDVSIAVITPFRRQKKQIEDRLEKEGIKDVKVGTVHSFQGQQKDYVIFSPVIDSLNIKWAIRFIGDKCNMINVAVTRARKQFIYLGNLDVAGHTDNYIAKLIKYIKQNGAVYSLYNTESSIFNENYNDRILQILQPELNVDDDKIGNYIEQKFKNGIMKDAKQSYEFLRYAMKNAKKEIYIIAPWIRENVVNEEFLQDLRNLRENECNIKILFGYKKGNNNAQNAEEIVQELLKTNSLGYASPEEVQRIIEEMYEIIGKEGLVYAPPIHAKILIIDNKYMCIGSHNWLSNAGKTNEKQRAIEGTKITTNIESINYVKEEYFKQETAIEV